MERGISYDVSWEDYRAFDAINQSSIKDGERSMLHMRDGRDNPKPATDPMKFGTLLHAGQLEPLEIANRYVVAPDLTEGIEAKVPRATKVFKERMKAFVEANEGKEVVTQDEYDRVLAIVTAIAKHPAASRLFGRQGGREVTLVWEDADTGLLCKARCDALVLDAWETIGDLKSTRDASPPEFVKSIARYGYGLQAAFCLDGLAACGHANANFVIIACESEPPHGVAAYEIDGDWLKFGRVDYRRILRQYAKCLSSGEWPGYSMEVEQPEVPKWLKSQYEGGQ